MGHTRLLPGQVPMIPVGKSKSDRTKRTASMLQSLGRRRAAALRLPNTLFSPVATCSSPSIGIPPSFFQQSMARRHVAMVHSRTISARPIDNRLLINGEFVPSVSGKKFDVINPNNEMIVTSVYEAGAEDVNLAVQAAKDAFPSWSGRSATERCTYLTKLADAKENLGISYFESITMGKPAVPDGKAHISPTKIPLMLSSSKPST